MKKLHVPSSLNKRLISTLMSNRKVDPNESKTFALKSTSEFATRSGDVFGKLQTLEKNHETWVSKNDTIESFDESGEPNSDPKSSGKSQEDFPKKKDSALVLKSKIVVPPKKEMAPKNQEADAVFKKPLPVNWKRKAGSFLNRSKKWTKYSLEDVPLSSDITNAAVAFQFLNGLNSRKEQKDGIEKEKGGDKIVFKKPQQKELKASAFLNEISSCKKPKEKEESGQQIKFKRSPKKESNASVLQNELSSGKEQKISDDKEESGNKFEFKKPKQKKRLTVGQFLSSPKQEDGFVEDEKMDTTFKKPKVSKVEEGKSGFIFKKPKRLKVDDQFLNELNSCKEQKEDEKSGIVFKKPKGNLFKKAKLLNVDDFVSERSSHKEHKGNIEEEEKSEDKIVFKRPKQKGPKVGGRIKTGFCFDDEDEPDVQIVKKEVLKELKTSQANITLAHLDEE